MIKDKKYVTIQDGVDFRTIAKIMSDRGYKMNHATARNVLILAIENLFSYSANEIGFALSREQINSLIHDQTIHDALADVLHLAYKELETHVHRSKKT